MLVVRLGKSFLASLILLLALTARGSAAAAPGGYFVSAEIPHSRYVMDARFDPLTGVLEGRQSITFENRSNRPIALVALEWDINEAQGVDVSCGGTKLPPRQDLETRSFKAPVFYELPAPVPPGGSVTLATVFRRHLEPAANGKFEDSRWYPRLWWEGRRGHDDYSVKLDLPQGYAVAASGRRNALTGRYEGAGINEFGIHLAKGELSESREVDGVLVTVLYTPEGKGAASVCLETAADAVAFYKKWIGFYPYPFLTLIPGGPFRWGGCPFATGIVTIHGMETYRQGEPPKHWQYITSHEIGHQYWSEWVLDGDNPTWLWIAMGIHMDTEYMLARKYDLDRRRAWTGNYLNAVGLLYDTTLDTTPGEESHFRYDRSNLVVHSKGPAFLNALEVVLGPVEFDRIFKAALHAYAGKSLGWREFQSFCQLESGQDLTWFFEAWVRGNSYLCYAIESRDCKPEGPGFRTEVRVRRLGTMAMPIPLKAAFEDGTELTALTDRTRALDAVVFHSQARLKDVVLDPEHRMAMVAKPLPELPAQAAVATRLGWDPAASPAVYAALAGLDFDAPGIWHELGCGLFEIGRLAEAAECFRKLSLTTGEAGEVYRFLARAILGAICDLQGNRASALEHYRAAIALEKGQSGSYGSLGMEIDRAWLEARLASPFARKGR